MTREVDVREKELTHQIHRELLSQHLEQVKNLTRIANKFHNSFN